MDGRGEILDKALQESGISVTNGQNTSQFIDICVHPRSISYSSASGLARGHAAHQCYLAIGQGVSPAVLPSAVPFVPSWHSLQRLGTVVAGCSSMA